MALRVLLADESSTIKKVFQLALQDFAVEVRSVNLGPDVLNIAHTFKPDILFADVLLQKRSGYEVCMDIKNDSNLKNVPVVLMWSGFMEIDEDKVQAAQANARLEKPFDVEALRKIVQDLVPKTRSQRLSSYLQFPKLPDFQDPRQQQQDVMEDEDTAVTNIPLDMGAEEDDFKPVTLKDQFRVNVDELGSNSDIPVDYTLPEEEPSTPPPAPQAQAKPTAIPLGPVPSAPPAPKPATNIPAAHLDLSSPLTEDQLEKIIRSQAKEIIEAVVWKVVPDLASQMIERELKRLLSQEEWTSTKSSP